MKSEKEQRRMHRKFKVYEEAGHVFQFIFPHLTLFTGAASL